MGQGLLNNESVQDAHCDPSRKTAKGARILRNIGEVARFFPLDEPVLCVGCGDGLEVEAWTLLGYEAWGMDLSRAKCNKALERGVSAISGSAEDLGQTRWYCNIYSAHTLEHCWDRNAALENFARLAISTVCVIVPLEPEGSANPSHLSPVRQLGDLVLPPDWRIVAMQERCNDEPEGVLVWKINGGGAPTRGGDLVEVS